MKQEKAKKTKQESKVQDIKAKKPARQAVAKPKSKIGDSLALTMENYILGAIGLLIIIIGYVMMVGKTDIFSFTKWNLSVIFIIGGSLFIIYAIMKKPKSSEEEVE